MMGVFTVFGVSAVAITAVLVEVFKKLIPARFVPLLAIGIGILVSILGTFSVGKEIILGGVVIGGMAMGLFDVIKKTVLNR